MLYQASIFNLESI